MSGPDPSGPPRRLRPTSGPLVGSGPDERASSIGDRRAAVTRRRRVTCGQQRTRPSGDPPAGAASRGAAGGGGLRPTVASLPRRPSAPVPAALPALPAPASSSAPPLPRRRLRPSPPSPPPPPFSGSVVSGGGVVSSAARSVTFGAGRRRRGGAVARVVVGAARGAPARAAEAAGAASAPSSPPGPPSPTAAGADVSDRRAAGVTAPASVPAPMRSMPNATTPPSTASASAPADASSAIRRGRDVAVGCVRHERARLLRRPRHREHLGAVRRTGAPPASERQGRPVRRDGPRTPGALGGRGRLGQPARRRPATPVPCRRPPAGAAPARASAPRGTGRSPAARGHQRRADRDHTHRVAAPPSRRARTPPTAAAAPAGSATSRRPAPAPPGRPGSSRRRRAPGASPRPSRPAPGGSSPRTPRARAAPACATPGSATGTSTSVSCDSASFAAVHSPAQVGHRGQHVRVGRVERLPRRAERVAHVREHHLVEVGTAEAARRPRARPRSRTRRARAAQHRRVAAAATQVVDRRRSRPARPARRRRTRSPRPPAPARSIADPSPCSASAACSAPIRCGPEPAGCVTATRAATPPSRRGHVVAPAARGTARPAPRATPGGGPTSTGVGVADPPGEVAHDVARVGQRPALGRLARRGRCRPHRDRPPRAPRAAAPSSGTTWAVPPGPAHGRDGRGGAQIDAHDVRHRIASYG